MKHNHCYIFLASKYSLVPRQPSQPSHTKRDTPEKNNRIKLFSSFFPGWAHKNTYKNIRNSVGVGGEMGSHRDDERKPEKNMLFCFTMGLGVKVTA